MSDLPQTKHVRFEFFPAAVSGLSTELPEGDLKTYVTDEHLVIVANSSVGPEVVYTAPLDSYSGWNKQTRSWELVTESGEEVAISRADSCGCGSRLRGYNAFPNALRVR